MRIGLITTLNTNIGDDLIREGIILVLQEVFKDQETEFVLVNKHQPWTVYPNWHPAHLARIARHLPRGRYRASRLIERLASRLAMSYFDSCDLVVQCGAPVLWPGCHRCAWAEPLWHHVVGRLYQQMPVLNLAAGACYPWEQQPSHIADARDEQYLKAILRYCRLTSVRDTLAQHLCATLGTETPLIPCSAFLTAGAQVGSLQDDGIVLINYMLGGGHYEWAQGIDPSIWRETVKTLTRRLQARHKLAFLCHNQDEHDLALDLAPEFPRLWPKTPQEYFPLVSRAKAALCNRMHASVALASMGVPSIAVCTDTRLLMVDAVGLPCLYVKEACAGLLEQGIEDLLSKRHQEHERLLALRKRAWNQYVEVVSSAI